MFSQSLLEGESGEHVIWNLLMKSRDVRSVVDVRQDKNFQEMDIDFLVENGERQFTPIEVKTDFKAQDTGNIVYEISTSGHLGCFEKTKARYIYYYVPGDKTAYMIDVKAMRTYIHEVRPEEKQMGDKSTGFLLPIRDLIDAKVIKRVHKGVM